MADSLAGGLELGGGGLLHEVPRCMAANQLVGMACGLRTSKCMDTRGLVRKSRLRGEKDAWEAVNCGSDLAIFCVWLDNCTCVIFWTGGVLRSLLGETMGNKV